MRNKPRNIAFVPVTAAHYALLRAWLERPHVREWWGEPDTEIGHIRAMVEGRDSTRPFLITLEGTPVGYIQYWFVADNRDAAALKEGPWLAELPDDAVGIDLTVGEEKLLSQGIGSAAAALMVERLRAAGHATIVIDPDAANRRAIRAYEKAGFGPIPYLEGRTPGLLVMQHDKNRETHP